MNLCGEHGTVSIFFEGVNAPYSYLMREHSGKLEVAKINGTRS